MTDQGVYYELDMGEPAKLAQSEQLERGPSPSRWPQQIPRWIAIVAVFVAGIGVGVAGHTKQANVAQRTAQSGPTLYALLTPLADLFQLDYEARVYNSTEHQLRIDTAQLIAPGFDPPDDRASPSVGRWVRPRAWTTVRVQTGRPQCPEGPTTDNAQLLITVSEPGWHRPFEVPVLDPANVLSQSRRADCAAIMDGARMVEARFEVASLDSEGATVGAVVRITTSGREPVEVDAVGSTPDLDVRVRSEFPTTIQPGDSVAVAVELAAVAACADPRAEPPVTVRARYPNWPRVQPWIEPILDSGIILRAC